MIIAEYVWIDGRSPTPQLRSKTKIIRNIYEYASSLEDFPTWNFDGSSVGLTNGGSSDVKLVPVCKRINPLYYGDFSEHTVDVDKYIILCETFKDGKPTRTNYRYNLKQTIDKHPIDRMSKKPWIGFEQEYTLFKGSTPLGFPKDRMFPPAQGPYYCGVGADEAYGREVIIEHMTACIKAGLLIGGTNGEVMPGQWEFQIGGNRCDLLTTSDELWIARWLLYRIGEKYNIAATLNPKPIPGDWNGAGLHANFSTSEMRSKDGYKRIEQACKLLGDHVGEHLKEYGAGYEYRLTGEHETAKYNEFSYGVGDRNASVRIPTQVFEDKCGYLEDRRPNANADPYRVSNILLKTIGHA